MENSLKMKRRTFLKAAAAGTAMAATGTLPYLSFTHEEALAAANETGETVVPTFCNMCGPRDALCGVYAFSKNGVFTKVAGMKEYPVNRGALCPKGQAAPQLVYSPDRIKKPLIRTGKKGEGKFREVSYDEAITYIADKLKEQKAKYGAKSLGILSPARRDYSSYSYRFLSAHGSPNYGHSGICAMQLSFTLNYTLGSRPAADFANADMIIIWGKQPVYSGPAQQSSRNVIDAKTRGAKIVSIKPTIEPDSALGFEWVPVRPGTDAALALAMLHVVTKENLIDKAFVDKWTFGYPQLVEHVKKYTPEWAEKMSGVDKNQIIRLAREYATTPKATIEYGNGLEHAVSASDAIRAIGILIAITGHLDRIGGNVWGTGSDMPPIKPVELMERYTQQWVDDLVGYEFPKAFQPFFEGTSCSYTRLFQSVLDGDPYKIRAIIAPGSQAIVSTRGGNNLIKALEELELFVVVDVMRTGEMPWADVVIPSLTNYEVDFPFLANANNIMARNKVIEPVAEGVSTIKFYFDLAVKMGYADDFWGGDVYKCMDDLLSNTGMTYNDLRKYPTGVTYKANPMSYEKYERVFASKSTRIDKGPYLNEGKVAIYNTLFEKAGFRALPEWTDPPESLTGSPELASRYPLVFSDYHTGICFAAGWQQNLPYLREIMPFPVLHINPDTAKARGIKNGDWVYVEGPHCTMKVRTEIIPGCRPDTVMLLHGWWIGCKELGIEDFPRTDGGANANAMYTFDKNKMYDPIVTAMTSQTLVQVRKA